MIKRKVHETKWLSAGKGNGFAIRCKTPTDKHTLHAFDRRDVTCKWCLRLPTTVSEVQGG